MQSWFNNDKANAKIEWMNENVYSLKFTTFVNENNGHVYVYVIYMKINVVYWKQMLYIVVMCT